MRSALLLLLPAFATCACAEEKAPLREPDRSPQETARIVRSLEPKIRAILKRLQVPGAAVVVVKDDQVVYLKGFGYRDLGKRLPFTPDTTTHIASTSKAFGATTVAIAAAEGKLSLDESPRRLLPDFRLKDSEADGGMTIADLMTHASGLPRTDMGWWPGTISIEEARRLLGEGEPTYPFRYAGQYSNMLVETAGRVAAAAYGRPWPEVLQEKVTGPLGMSSTRLWTLPNTDPNAAVGYYVTPEGGIQPEVMNQWPLATAMGGLQSSARDLGIWLRFHLNGGEVNGRRLLPASALRETHRSRFAWSGTTTTGLGWFQNTRRGVEVVEHGGYLPGFETTVQFVPERRLGVAVLTNNAGRGGPFPIVDALFDRLLGKPDEREWKKVGKLNGLYAASDGTSTLHLRASGTELWASRDEERPIRLRKQDEKTWASYDPRDPKITLTVADDQKRKGRKTFGVTRDGASTAYAHAPTTYRADLTPRELYRRVSAATGPRTGKTLYCRFRGRYASDAVDSVGRLYRAAVGKAAFFEAQYVGPNRILFNHLVFNPGRTSITDDTFRVDDVNALPHPEAMAGYANESAGLPSGAKVEIIGERDWKGERAYVVRTRWKDGAERLDTYSKTRFLPLRRTILGLWSEMYEEYQSVDGVQVPMRLTIMDPNRAEYRIQVEKAEWIYEPQWAFSPRAWDPPRLTWKR